MLLQLCISTLNHVATDANLSASKTRVALEMLNNKLPIVWSRLWAIRTPFLDSELACLDVQNDELATMHASLVDCAMLIDMLSERKL